MSFQRTEYIYLAVIGGVMALLCVIAWYVVSTTDERHHAAEPRDSVSTLDNASYTSLSGEPASLLNYVGTPLVLVSWATWSPLSHDALVTATRVAAGYQSGEVVVVGLNRAEQASTIRDFLEYIAMPESVVVLLDSDDFFYTTVEGYTMPEIHLYNPAGERVASWHGAVDESTLRTHIDEMRAGVR